MKYLKHLFTLFFCAVGIFALSACDGTKDAGDHLEDAGDSIKEAAEDAGDAVSDAAEDTKETLQENSTEPKIDSSNK